MVHAILYPGYDNMCIKVVIFNLSFIIANWVYMSFSWCCHWGSLFFTSPGYFSLLFLPSNLGNTKEIYLYDLTKVFKAISVYDAVMLKESWICTRYVFFVRIVLGSHLSVCNITLLSSGFPWNLGTWDYNVFLERTCFFTPIQCSVAKRFPYQLAQLVP